jgi:hypothetical protein
MFSRKPFHRAAPESADYNANPGQNPLHEPIMADDELLARRDRRVIVEIQGVHITAGCSTGPRVIETVIPVRKALNAVSLAAPFRRVIALATVSSKTEETPCSS